MGGPLLRIAVTIGIASSMMGTVTHARSQYLFFDTDGDGACEQSHEYPSLYQQTDTIDVWVDTSKNLDGTTAVCASGEELTISAYELLLDTYVSASGNFQFLSWTNARTEFPVEEHKTLGQGRAWISYSSAGAATHLPPGKYLLGQVVYRFSGGCLYGIAFGSSDPAVPGAETKFYSKCSGGNSDNWLRLGTDFDGSCGIYLICDDVNKTTWGHIKAMYR